ncbi:F0F1 ATP synthase subunit epsilon [Loktanella sp. M215]|uniref:F0F1 ATP synthase subunit epsilon n=1 Tax=Loktanella sp. M215 TaxID=2675431 RepID=UPI001F2252C2|nr:F0F1 ATP synthase subunit epsilon [Loktanella sp. M215]MCF7701446.1 F0F1 ATP synthase subunit epsilon [Loktanella sp. M215]
MNLRIVTPLTVVVTTGIDRMTAEDASGSFGILPGHAPFLTALAISVVSWTTAGVTLFCAVRGGVLSVDGDVAIATPEAVPGDDLATLDAAVLARFRADADAERVDRSAATALQLNAIRRMVSRLSASPDTGEFR